MSLKNRLNKFKEFITPKKSETLSASDVDDISDIYEDFCESLDIKIVKGNLTEALTSKFMIYKNSKDEIQKIIIKILVNPNIINREDLVNVVNSKISCGVVYNSDEYKDLILRYRSMGYKVVEDFIYQNLGSHYYRNGLAIIITI